MLDALRSLNALDTGGTIAGTLDFTDPSRRPASSSTSPRSADAPGGLEALGEPSEAADAQGYEFK